MIGTTRTKAAGIRWSDTGVDGKLDAPGPARWKPTHRPGNSEPGLHILPAGFSQWLSPVGYGLCAMHISARETFRRLCSGFRRPKTELTVIGVMLTPPRPWLDDSPSVASVLSDTSAFTGTYGLVKFKLAKPHCRVKSQRSKRSYFRRADLTETAEVAKFVFSST
jgi:hypothetical protein